jgi:hypothetical protein
MATLTNEVTKSQCAMILAYMQSGKSITGLEALKLYGCFRLPARIADLKKKGYNIEVEMIKQNGKRFASYKLIKTQ